MVNEGREAGTKTCLKEYMKIHLNGCSVLSDFHVFGSHVELFPVVNTSVHVCAKNQEIW